MTQGAYVARATYVTCVTGGALLGERRGAGDAGGGARERGCCPRAAQGGDRPSAPRVTYVTKVTYGTGNRCNGCSALSRRKAAIAPGPPHAHSRPYHASDIPTLAPIPPTRSLPTFTHDANTDGALTTPTRTVLKRTPTVPPSSPTRRVSEALRTVTPAVCPRPPTGRAVAETAQSDPHGTRSLLPRLGANE